MFFPASYPKERDARANTVEGVTKSLEGNLHKINILPCLHPMGRDGRAYTVEGGIKSLET